MDDNYERTLKIAGNKHDLGNSPEVKFQALAYLIEIYIRVFTMYSKLNSKYELSTFSEDQREVERHLLANVT